MWDNQTHQQEFKIMKQKNQNEFFEFCGTKLDFIEEETNKRGCLLIEN